MAGLPARILGNVADNGTLAFNRSDTVSFAGVDLLAPAVRRRLAPDDDPTG